MTSRGSQNDSRPCHSVAPEDAQVWMDQENSACHFRDERLKKRFRLLLEQFWKNMGQSIPFACQDWASTKAAYRFFSNDHVSEQDILGGHFQATSDRFDLPVSSRREAIEKLDWYAMRWNIETFHKILKSGCNAEESRLRTAERLANLIAVFCTISWRIFWLTMLNRTCPDAEPEKALTSSEIDLLNCLVKDSKGF